MPPRNAGWTFASSTLLPISFGGRPQNNETIKRKRAATLLAHEERIDIDRLDDVAQIAREPAEIDQCLAQSIIVAGLAAAKSVEQPPGAGLADHLQRLLAVEGCGRETDVLEQLDPDAAQPEHDGRTHFDVALHPEHGFGSARYLLGDQDAVEPSGEGGGARGQRGCGFTYRGGVRQIEDHQPGIALVRNRRRDALQ